MFRFIDAVILVGLTAGLLVPVTYALSTLRRMRHKKVYPALRLKSDNGESSSISVQAVIINAQGGSHRQP